MAGPLPLLPLESGWALGITCATAFIQKVNTGLVQLLLAVSHYGSVPNMVTDSSQPVTSDINKPTPPNKQVFKRGGIDVFCLYLPLPETREPAASIVALSYERHVHRKPTR